MKNVGVGTQESDALHKLVHLAHGRRARKGTQVVQQVIHLREQQGRRVGVPRWLLPEGTNVDTSDLWSVKDLAERPHECAVDPHELLHSNGIGLIQHHADLVLIALEDLDDRRELVRDVQFERIEEQDDHVDTLGEPLDNLIKVVVPVQALFLSRQHTRCVNKTEALQHRRVHNRAFETGEKVVAIEFEAAERRPGSHRQSVARNRLVRLAIHDRHKPVRRGLGANSLPREVPAENVLDEARFANRVRANKEHHGRSVELRVCEDVRVKAFELGRHFDRPHHIPVNGLDPVDHRLVPPGLIRGKVSHGCSPTRHRHSHTRHSRSGEGAEAGERDRRGRLQG
mmetsp:Transcript_12241/g.35430  ORF Transcript_12241/g.35430 Transcript_12241/m.35430 type:complete len:341 (-) Transcript_12241:20-1042(-)